MLYTLIKSEGIDIVFLYRRHVVYGIAIILHISFFKVLQTYVINGPCLFEL